MPLLSEVRSIHLCCTLRFARAICTVSSTLTSTFRSSPAPSHLPSPWKRARLATALVMIFTVTVKICHAMPCYNISFQRDFPLLSFNNSQHRLLHAHPPPFPCRCCCHCRLLALALPAPCLPSSPRSLVGVAAVAAATMANPGANPFVLPLVLPGGPPPLPPPPVSAPGPRFLDAATLQAAWGRADWQRYVMCLSLVFCCFVFGRFLRACVFWGKGSGRVSM